MNAPAHQTARPAPRGVVAPCRIVCGLTLLVSLVAGCATDAPPPQMEIDPATATVAYWLDKPATASVADADYDRLFAAIERALEPTFDIDRRDYRGGAITAGPLDGTRDAGQVSPQASGQFFEFWRTDVAGPEALVENSIATVSRRVEVTVGRQGSKFVAHPRVVVLRQAVREQQLLTAKRPERAVRGDPTDGRRRLEGSREADAGRQLPDTYWYATGRDHALERAIADRVRGTLR